MAANDKLIKMSNEGFLPIYSFHLATHPFCPSSVLTLKCTHSSLLWFSPCHTHILSFFTYHLASHTFCLSSHLQCTHFAILEISPCNTHTLLFFSSPLAIRTLCLSGVLTLQYTHFASVLILPYTYLFFSTSHLFDAHVVLFFSSHPAMHKLSLFVFSPCSTHSLPFSTSHLAVHTLCPFSVLTL